MANSKKRGTTQAASATTRQSISLPRPIADVVRKIANDRRLSANQVVVDLIEAGIEARNREKERFMSLAEELATTKSARRQEEIKLELARLTFGE